MQATAGLRGALAGDRARAALLTAAAAGVTFVAVTRVLRSGPSLLLLLGAVLLGVLVLERPRATAATMLVLSAPLFALTKRQLVVGGITTDAFELLSYALILRWAISRGRERRMPSWRFAGPVVLLVAGATAGAVYGLLHGADFALVLGQYKTYLIYLLVLPLSVLFATLPEKERLERWVVNFCVAGSLVVLGAAAIGSSVPSEAPNLPLNTFGATAQVQRIRPAMLWLLFLATLIVLGRVFFYGMTRGSALRLALFTGVWLFSFNRSSWLALVVSGTLLALLRPGVRHPGRGLRTVALALLVFPVFLIVADKGVLGPSLQAVPERVISVVSPEVTNEDAVQDRTKELPFAFDALRRSPVFGVGLGRSYGARRPVWNPRLGVVEFQDRQFSHNSIVFAYLQTGLLGIAALVALGVAATRAARGALRSLPKDVALRTVVSSVALLGYAVQSITQTSLLHRPGITAAAIAMVLATRPVDARD